LAPADGQVLVLLGETRDELGGSEWAHHVHGHLGGRPPRVDLGAEQRLARLLVDAARDGVLRAAHDVSDGGLAQTLAELVMAGRVGLRVKLPEGTDPFVALFSESVARAVVAVDRADLDGFLATSASAGVPAAVLGEVGGTSLDVEGRFEVPVEEIRSAAAATLPALFG
jgi:phosphoribosylformylglycinamidine synthase